jgi:hypothetical protein
LNAVLVLFDEADEADRLECLSRKRDEAGLPNATRDLDLGNAARFSDEHGCD